MASFGSKSAHLYRSPAIQFALSEFDESELYVLKCLVACGQLQVLDSPLDLEADAMDVSTLTTLQPMDTTKSSIKSAFSALAAMIDSWDKEKSAPSQSFLSASDWVSNFNEGWDSPGIFHTQIFDLIDFDGKIPDGTSMAATFRDNSQCDCPKVTAGSSMADTLRDLVRILQRLDRFYDGVGGIVGYQLECLKLLASLHAVSQNGAKKEKPKRNASRSGEFQQFLVPQGQNLSKDKEAAVEAAIWGLMGVPKMAEIFPLGGAGDRLGLVDEATGECLPVAMLPYCGRTLLEGLIRDLQAREHLYYCVTGETCVTPIAIMTSAAKQNHQRVTAICESHGWFGRGKHNFKLFEQPLVPTVAAKDGKWLSSEPLTPVLKPGGHGAIWKLACDEGVFQWFKEKNRQATLVRQISNPFAATDVTMLALSGIGLHGKKKFGFASCDRNVGTAEGVNVLVETLRDDGQWEYVVTCIEYTEFEKLGIADVSVSPGSMQSQFPANTNILFADLATVEHLASTSTSASLPGLIMNLKKAVTYVDQFGERQSVQAGRLECTMQNIADSIPTVFPCRLSPHQFDELSTFLVYNDRRKVTSSAKRRRKPNDMSLHQTPDGSILDLQRNAADLLSSCGVVTPRMESNQCYLSAPPPFLCLFHPALGPLWDVISQKVRRGSISAGSEVQLEISELDWEDVYVSGSLLINASNVMGECEMNMLRHGQRCGRCRLHRVTVANKGIDWSSPSNVYWQHKVARHESMQVILHGDAEFEAMDVHIEGNCIFEVPAGHKMVVKSGSAGMVTEVIPLEMGPEGSFLPSWKWSYHIVEEKSIALKMMMT